LSRGKLKICSELLCRLLLQEINNHRNSFQEDFGIISRELLEKIFKGFSEEEQQMLANLKVRTIENFS